MGIPQVVTVAVSGPTELYFSTQGFISSASDTPANTCFDPRIKDTIEYTREVSCTAWGQGAEAKSALGTVDLDNTDGELDFLLSEPWRNRTVTIRRGLATEAYDDHAHVAFAVIDRAVASDLYTIQLALRDKGALLDIAMNPELYPALAGAPTLEGTPRPVCIGDCEGVPLTMVDGATLQYDVHDDLPLAIDAVLDQGVLLTEGNQWEASTESTTFGVTRLTNPAGKQTANVRGASVGSTLIESLPDFINYVLSRGGTNADAGDVDHYSIDALEAATGYKLCYWGRDATTIASVLTQALNSYTGWWYYDRMGLLRVGRIERPSSSPVVVLNDINLIEVAPARLDGAKGLSDTIGCARNWGPYGGGDLAGSVYLDPARAARLLGTQQVRKGATALHETYAQARSDEPIKTLLAHETDGQSEADRLTALYPVENYFYECAAALEGSLSYTLEPGDTVEIQTDRFGLDAGKQLLVVAVRTRLMSSIVNLTLWGEGPQAGDFPSGS